MARCWVSCRNGVDVCMDSLVFQGLPWKTGQPQTLVALQMYRQETLGRAAGVACSRTLLVWTEGLVMGSGCFRTMSFPHLLDEVVQNDQREGLVSSLPFLWHPPGLGREQTSPAAAVQKIQVWPCL